MSPRAACRLETLGFEHVFDYVPGKADWLARGLAREGEKAREQRAGELVRDDVVTARFDERLREIRSRVEASPYGFGFVVSDGGTLLGRLGKSALEGDPDATAGEVMETGPSTIRANAALEPLAQRMRSRNLTSLPVTTPEGRLLGVVRRDEVESALP